MHDEEELICASHLLFNRCPQEVFAAVPHHPAVDIEGKIRDAACMFLYLTQIYLKVSWQHRLGWIYYRLTQCYVFFIPPFSRPVFLYFELSCPVKLSR